MGSGASALSVEQTRDLRKQYEQLRSDGLTEDEAYAKLTPMYVEMTSAYAEQKGEGGDDSKGEVGYQEKVMAEAKQASELFKIFKADNRKDDRKKKTRSSFDNGLIGKVSERFFISPDAAGKAGENLLPRSRGHSPAPKTPEEQVLENAAIASQLLAANEKLKRHSIKLDDEANALTSSNYMKPLRRKSASAAVDTSDMNASPHTKAKSVVSSGKDSNVGRLSRQGSQGANTLTKTVSNSQLTMTMNSITMNPRRASRTNGINPDSSLLKPTASKAAAAVTVVETNHMNKEIVPLNPDSSLLKPLKGAIIQPKDQVKDPFTQSLPLRPDSQLFDATTSYFLKTQGEEKSDNYVQPRKKNVRRRSFATNTFRRINDENIEIDVTNVDVNSRVSRNGGLRVSPRADQAGGGVFTPVEETVSLGSATSLEAAWMETPQDSWESVAEQTYCDVCDIVYKSSSMYENHIKFSQSHAIMIKKRQKENDIAMGNLPEYIHSEGVTYRMIYSGSKFYWQYKFTIQIDIFDHINSKCIEVVSYDIRKGIEMPRIYLDERILASTLQQTINDNVNDLKKVMFKKDRFLKEEDVDTDALMLSERSMVFSSYMLNALKVDEIALAEGVLKLNFTKLNTEEESAVLSELPKGLIPVIVGRKRITVEEITAMEHLESAFVKALNQGVSEETALQTAIDIMEEEVAAAVVANMGTRHVANIS